MLLNVFVGIWAFTTALERFFLEMEIFYIIPMIPFKRFLKLAPAVPPVFLFVARSSHLQQLSHLLPNV